VKAFSPFSFQRLDAPPPWSDAAPARAELFGVERLEQHAESLARAQPVSAHPPRVPPLSTRLRDNAAVLLAAYRASAAEVEAGRSIVPAAEWLLDNYHLVEAQIREIREDLPPGYYRQLPKLSEGPFAGYPRVFGLAWAFVAHSDSHFDPEALRRYLVAYQRAQPLTIGELWAVAITLRIVLVENLRRLADQITAAHRARAEADALADAQLIAGRPRHALEAELADWDGRRLSDAFAAQLAKRLRDHDPETTPALGWLEDRLEAQGNSIDAAVNHALERQGASNVTVRNVITSMRLISDIDWPDLFESVSLVDARLRADSAFGAMDFPSRNLYRTAIEELSRGSGLSEIEVAGRALEASRSATMARAAEPGWHLVSGGRRDFERAIGFRPSPWRWPGRLMHRLGLVGYVGLVGVVTAALLATCLWALWFPGVGAGWLALWALVAVLPASEAATALVNRAITWGLGPTILPGLELKDGVPTELRTMVVVPTLLTGEDDLREQIGRLEVHFLSNDSGDMTFALLTDGVDAAQAVAPGDDALLALGRAEIAELNARHAPGPAGPRFLLLHRRRQFNPDEGVWMGWERKRGKLHELNRLLRGATDTSFETVDGAPPAVPEGVRYVITLDADTRMPRDAATRLVGKMAHPLNLPSFDPSVQRVTAGHAILQPRVTPSLPDGREASAYQRIISGPGGMDPYAAAVSDVYQDLFGEGSYTGKGIYDVDAFEASLAGRVPPNTLLSHDLFEGVFARAGLASDVEFVEEFPARYDVDARRQHRWTRGDWQLLPWIAGTRSVPPVGLWKMFDNLRRSLLAPFTLAALWVGWLLPWPATVAATLVLLAVVALPAFLPCLGAVLPHRSGVRLDSHLRALAGDLRTAAMQTFLTVAFLADHAYRMLDAVLRTLTRLWWTRRRMLEWITAAQAAGGPRLGLPGFAVFMVAGVALGLLVAGSAAALAPASWPVVLPFGLLWVVAPALAFWVSRRPSLAADAALTAEDARELRLIARRTWRFFETFVTVGDNMLPPDNFQVDPKPLVAHRTSPTNLGLHLLSAVAARDFGWAGALETVERLESSLDSMLRLPRHRGHFFNWYDTQDLRVLEPAYVSSVDSGNLAGHLIALANACEEPLAAQDPRPGLRDALDLAWEAIAAAPSAGEELRAILATIGSALEGCEDSEALSRSVENLASRAQATLESHGADDLADARFLGHRLAQMRRRASPRRRARQRRPRTAGGTIRRGRGNRAAAGHGDGLRLSARPRPQAPLDRLLRRRQPPRPELLRPACLGIAARQPARHRQGRRTDTPLVPAWSRRHAPGLRIGIDLLVGIDVRVSDADAGDARAARKPAGTDQPSGGGAAAGLWPVARRALGRIGIGLQRPRPRAHLPVFELRRARPRHEARAGEERGDRTLCDRPRRDDRPPRRGAQFRQARDIGARGLTASTKRSTSTMHDAPKVPPSRSCATSWRITRA
jgi:cyclic beta-1,2-glucan synthetase